MSATKKGKDRLSMQKRRYWIGDVIRDDGGLGTSIVHWREGMVSFLAGRVPDLELDGVPLDIHR